MSLVSAFTGARTFPYGYGRLGVLQQQLLSISDVDRLIGAHSKEQLLQILSEIPLTKRVMPRHAQEEIVPACERWLQAELTSMVGEDVAPVFKILWLREDAALIAYELKKCHALTTGAAHEEELTHTVTAYDRVAIVSSIRDGKTSGRVDAALMSFLLQQRTKGNVTPQSIDRDVAGFIAYDQLILANASKSILILRYVQHLIDIQNIRTMRRAPPETLANDLLDGGEIDKRGLLTSDDAQLLHVTQGTTLPPSFLKEITDADSTITLERVLHKAAAKNIADMRSSTLTLEPIFAFGAMALSHLHLIRTILIGKAALLDPAEIRTMLPPFFSTSFSV